TVDERRLRDEPRVNAVDQQLRLHGQVDEGGALGADHVRTPEVCDQGRAPLGESTADGGSAGDRTTTQGRYRPLQSAEVVRRAAAGALRRGSPRACAWHCHGVTAPEGISECT